MQTFLVATGLVAVAEIGDKTQLLSLVLATRFRRPWPIVAGIAVATLLNHAAAAGVGAWITAHVAPDVLRWILGISFVAMAAWALVPDKLEDDPKQASRLGVFATTLVAFFLAETGDKTQVATIALAAQQQAAFLAVVAGTTLGMMIANVPVVFLGERLTRRLPLKTIRVVAAALFALMGVWIILRA
ncbi:MAG TPA: TMEM165/GDT1 family protein [Xanthomonadales bacterium]|nr:TMEM165/GDT1 family protein [Xanthomonadales bacterium]